MSDGINVGAKRLEFCSGLKMKFNAMLSDVLIRSSGVEGCDFIGGELSSRVPMLTEPPSLSSSQ